MTSLRYGFVIGMTFSVIISLLGDRDTYRRGHLRHSWRTFRHSPLVSREIWDQLKDYNRPEFHPDDSDTNELVEQWRNELFGEHGTLNDQLIRATSTATAAA